MVVATHWVGGLLTCLALNFAGLLMAADSPTDKKGDTPKTAKSDKSDDGPAHRLPPHYNKIVDDTQKTKIYQIQDRYSDDIKKLMEQLDAIRAKRDKEIRDVLTPAQQKELDKVIAESKKDEKGSSSKKDGKDSKK